MLLTMLLYMCYLPFIPSCYPVKCPHHPLVAFSCSYYPLSPVTVSSVCPSVLFYFLSFYKSSQFVYGTYLCVPVDGHVLSSLLDLLGWLGLHCCPTVSPSSECHLKCTSVSNTRVSASHFGYGTGLRAPDGHPLVSVVIVSHIYLHWGYLPYHDMSPPLLYSVHLCCLL